MVYHKRHPLTLNAEPPHTCYHSVFSALFYRLARTLNGLSSAALKESNANRLTKYSAANLTSVSLSPPLPVSILCRPANGLSPTGRLGSEAEPSVRPLVEKTAEAAPGPEVSFAALRTAAVRAAGLAPRMVSTTEVDLMTRKVGILGNVHVSIVIYKPSSSRHAGVSLGVYVRADAILLCNFLLAIHVHLDELHLAWLGLFLCQALEDWRDCLAWSAPIRVEVDDSVFGLRQKLGEV